MTVRTDFSHSLEELIGDLGVSSGGSATPLVVDIMAAWRKPLSHLSDAEIGDLIFQRLGFPYVLDLVWPKLRTEPLFDGGNYPGDVLSSLIRADASIWTQRAEHRDELPSLYRAALSQPEEQTDAFRESLNLPGSDWVN